jgi:hypothetical protein
MRKNVTTLMLSSLLVLAACGTQMKVAEVDNATGALKSDKGTVTKATVVTSRAASLAKFGGTAYVTNGGEFGVNQLKATNLFTEVLNYDDLQKLIVAKNLQDKVPSVGEPIGLSRLAKVYKPFLWVSFKRITKENKPYLQMIATNPENLEELFVAEVFLDFVWAGVNDQNSRYPLFNAFIEWARKNP